MRPRILVSVLGSSLALLLCGAQTGLAQFTPPCGAPCSSADAICRKEIGKRAKKLADILLRETVKCQKLKMAGKITNTTNCNDPQQLPGALKVAKAEAKFDQRVGVKCAGASTPVNNGYVLCPAPCQAIPITGYSGGPNTVVACIDCRIKETNALNWTAIDTAYGANPPLPGTLSDPRTKCQKFIGTAMRRYFSTRVKEQQKCQYAEDLSNTGADCSIAQTGPDQKVAKALAKAKLLISKCDPATLTGAGNLTSCGTDIVSEQNCIQLATESYTDPLFHEVYFPAPEAVFVSSDLNDATPDGTVLHPFPTISAAMTYAAANNKTDIYIDGVGAYTETLTLVSNVHLQGGFNHLDNWLNDGTTTSVFSGSTSAVFGSGVSNTTVEGLTISAANATGTGNSSYGVRLINPSGVTIRDCTVNAGSGSNGSGGSNGTPGAVGGGGGNGGNGCENSTTTCSSCSRPGGGAGGTNPSCPTGTAGGAGGGGGHCSEPPTNGGTGGPGSGTSGGTGGSGGSSCHGVPSAGGNAGTVGNGTDGAGGANFGSKGTTYTPANGSSGALGSHGSGGGGGGGGGGGDAVCDSWGGGGGGGGSGGCRGTIATGGTGAGGSFGVWVSGGTATIEDTTINTVSGGTGGGGGTGGAGGAGSGGGGAGSGEDDSIPGAIGGSGSNGGRGGHGGGGGGGPSIGIVCGGGAGVSRSGNTINTGNGGSGGSSAGNNGSAGLKVNENC